MTPRTNSAYDHLHDRIASGSLAPGEVISETALAQELGCSRTPIGEALRRLAEDGLVEQVPRYGTIVRHISTEELQELFEVREALECFAARKAAERITTKTLNDMRTLCEKIDQETERVKALGTSRLEGESLRRFLAYDMAFHQLILSSAGNKKLFKIAQRTGSVAHVFQTRRGSHTLQRVKDANEMHKSIVEALEKHDEEAAAKLLTEHIRYSALISVAADDSSSDDDDRASLSSLDLPDFLRKELSASGLDD